MNLINRGGSGAIQPEYSTNTAQVIKGKLTVKLSVPDTKIATVEGKMSRTIKDKDMTKRAKIHGSHVNLTVTDTSTGKLVRMAVKIKDLANTLNVGIKVVKDAIQLGKLDDIVSNKLQNNLSQQIKSKKRTVTIEESDTISQDESSGSEMGVIVQSSSLQKPPVLDPEVRAKLVSNLRAYGLTKDEFEQIELLYASNVVVLETETKDGVDTLKEVTLDTLTEPTHIRGNKQVPPLPRSLVYIPNGPRKGMYVLLKTHGGVEEIGVGAYNRVTLALNLDTGEKKVFRNAKKKDVPDQEIEANKLTARHPEHFTAGDLVESYKGKWKSRELALFEGKDGKMWKIIREKNIPKDQKDLFPLEKNVEKVGFIMDFIEGGDLWDRLDAFPPLTYKEKVGIALEYAQHVAFLHDELKLVHYDQKVENVFMTKDGKPRLADFGYTVKKGTRINSSYGTAGIKAPEVVLADNLPYCADFPADVWGMGCVLADLMKTDWYFMNGQKDDDYELILDENVLNNIKDQCFPKCRQYGTMDFVINKCLQLDPDARPTASTVAFVLETMYKQL